MYNFNSRLNQAEIANLDIHEEQMNREAIMALWSFVNSPRFPKKKRNWLNPQVLINRIDNVVKKWID